MPAAQLPTGEFAAYSTTAMGVTGDLEITPGRFKFAYQDYAVGTPTRVDAKSISPSGGSWSTLLIVPEDGTVLVWPVTRVTVAKDAPNDDLCRRQPTRFIVTGTTGTTGKPDDDELHLAALSSTKPDTMLAQSELCGTYNYFIPREEPRR